MICLERPRQVVGQYGGLPIDPAPRPITAVDAVRPDYTASPRTSTLTDTAVEQPTRVVLVDDTADLRMLLRMVLTRSGFDVVDEAGDGLAGIAAVKEHRPDLVLLDVSMPVMDGLTALPQIRALAPQACIVVFTGFMTPDVDRTARAHGADDVIQKGGNTAQLVAHIGRAVTLTRERRAGA